MSLDKQILSYASIARDASIKVGLINKKEKNKILENMALALDTSREEIIFRNEIDVTAAKETGLNQALIDRLILNDKRIDSMIQGIKDIIKLDDPIGTLIEETTRPNGLKISKVRVPIGVIGIIYESRPNVTVDSAALCLKSGNAVILRGGKEAFNTNHTLFKIISKAAIDAGMPNGAIQFFETTDRVAIDYLLVLDEFVDLIIPRGGEKMIKSITEKSRIPVLKHDRGLCHTYVDKSADLKMAKDICLNAKVQRPGVCNAMETLLVHADIANKFLPDMARIFQKNNVKLKGCEKTVKLLSDNNIQTDTATEEDWDTEYLDLILSIKIVSEIDEAMSHINYYGSGHSEAIITSDEFAANKFLQMVDAAAVYVNASTRFTDGAEFGLGAEMGISTQKMHARGPVGIKELTSYKYVIYGNGQIR